MRDVLKLEEGEDIPLVNSDAPRAANIVSKQLGSLSFANTFGVDLEFFLESEFQFPIDSFRTYLVNRLLESQINVVQCVTTIQRFTNSFIYAIGDTPIKDNEGLII